MKLEKLPGDRRHPFFLLILAFSVLPLSGCGASAEKTQRVSGTVTFDGKPLESGVMMFVPVGKDASPVRVSLNTNGGYEAFAPAGEYKVTINSYSNPTPDLEEGDPGYKTPKSLLPVKYSSLVQTPLTCVVGDQESSADFALTAK